MKSFFGGLICAVFVGAVASTMVSCSNGSDDPKYIPTSYSSTNFKAVAREDGIHFFLATEPEVRGPVSCYTDPGTFVTEIWGKKFCITVLNNVFRSEKNSSTNVEMNGVLYDEYIFPFVKSGEIYYFSFYPNNEKHDFSIKSVGNGIYANVYDISASLNYSDEFIEVNVWGDFLSEVSEIARGDFLTNGSSDGNKGFGEFALFDKNTRRSIKDNKWTFRIEGDEFLSFKEYLAENKCYKNLQARIEFSFPKWIGSKFFDPDIRVTTDPISF